jgi:hypothetical protein
VGARLQPGPVSQASTADCHKGTSISVSNIPSTTSYFSGHDARSAEHVFVPVGAVAGNVGGGSSAVTSFSMGSVLAGGAGEAARTPFSTSGVSASGMGDVLHTSFSAVGVGAGAGGAFCASFSAGGVGAGDVFCKSSSAGGADSALRVFFSAGGAGG